MKNFEALAQECWKTPSLEQKKVILHNMVDSFQYKTKQAEFRRKIDQLKFAIRADKLAADIMLADSMKVIK